MNTTENRRRSWLRARCVVLLFFRTQAEREKHGICVWIVLSRHRTNELWPHIGSHQKYETCQNEWSRDRFVGCAAFVCGWHHHTCDELLFWFDFGLVHDGRQMIGFETNLIGFFVLLTTNFDWFYLWICKYFVIIFMILMWLLVDWESSKKSCVLHGSNGSFESGNLFA